MDFLPIWVWKKVLITVGIILTIAAFFCYKGYRDHKQMMDGIINEQVAKGKEREHKFEA